MLMRRRGFHREAQLESRTPCPCELCCLRHRRMLYPKGFSGEPLRFRRVRGPFTTNFPLTKPDWNRAWRNQIKRRKRHGR